MRPDLSHLPDVLHEPVINWYERCADDAKLTRLLAAQPGLANELSKVIACSPTCRFGASRAAAGIRRAETRVCEVRRVR